MALTPGTRLGPYEIAAQIGAGGMGEVYRARDTKLDRDVAIKILPEAFAHDADRLARFQREAKTLASLNHPNIATIYGLEESRSGGSSDPPTTALVMELVEGEDLSQRIARGAIPLDEALPIAKQIADALDAAHEQGVIHRDLKPANIKVTPDGSAKVLDFGLAKLTAGSGQPTAGSPHLSMSPTITSPAMMTGIGVLLGTAAYMSPEQAKGREADKRSDVWAFGAVLYEMLTGRRAFDGEDLSDTLANVLKVDPDWSRVPADVPPLIRTLLQECLARDRRRRIADVGAIQFALAHAQTHVHNRSSSAAPVAPPRSLARRLAVPSATLLIGTALAGAAFFAIQRSTPQPITRSLIAPTSGTLAVAVDGNDRSIAISPDGSKIAYTGGNNTLLFVRALDQLQPKQIAGPGTPREPSFSPDGAWVVYIAEGILQKVPAAGGPPVRIAPIDGGMRGTAWAPDNTIIFATGNGTTGLQQVSASGGEPKILTRPNREKGERDHFWPQVLPGGRAVLFTIVSSGAIENAQIAVLDLRDNTQKVVLSSGSDAHYVEDGYLVYGVEGTVRAVPFDVERLEVVGTPVPLVQQVVTTRTDGAANFGVSVNGTLAYVSGTTAGDRRTLVWVDRTGREETLKVPPRAYAYAQLSPDGTRVALDIRDQQNDIWIWDLARETLQRLTFDPGLNRDPVWSPDGTRVAFSRQVGGGEEVYWQAADGAGMAVPLTTESKGSRAPNAFSPDATALLYTPTNPPYDIWMTRVGGTPSAGTPLLASPANETGAIVSPDGRWLAYQSDESGRNEIYVRPFPKVDTGRWQISTGGGTRPQWNRNGRELFYLETRGGMLAVIAVAIKGGSSFEAGSPTMLFQGRYLAPQAGRHAYDVSPDGKRFLMIKNAETEGEETPPQLVVVQNWLSELKRLVPRK